MPSIAVVIPVASDHHRLPGLLKSLQAQDRLPDEVIIVSAHALPDVAAEFSLPISALKNPSGAIPAALNIGIGAANSEIILRMDVHARPFPDYTRLCLDALEGSGADVVGGHLKIEPGGAGDVAAAIALAVGHPLGAGDARYRLQSPHHAGDVDTVPYGCYRKTLWERLGGYDESLLANEDYEFHWRVRAAGGRVYFDPAIRVAYYARATLGELARQYFRYGWWKAQMLRRHPRSLRWRQALPVIALAVLVSSILIAFFSGAGRLFLLSAFILYFLSLGLAGVPTAVQRRSFVLLLALPLAFATVHFAWSAGAWANWLTGGRWPFFTTETQRAQSQ